MEATQESHLREMQNSQAQLNKMKDMLDQSSSPELQRLKDVSIHQLYPYKVMLSQNFAVINGFLLL